MEGSIARPVLIWGELVVCPFCCVSVSAYGAYVAFNVLGDCKICEVVICCSTIVTSSYNRTTFKLKETVVQKTRVG